MFEICRPAFQVRKLKCSPGSEIKLSCSDVYVAFADVVRSLYLVEKPSYFKKAVFRPACVVH